jgi:hypothetical protein
MKITTAIVTGATPLFLSLCRPIKMKSAFAFFGGQQLHFLKQNYNNPFGSFDSDF